jgi:homoserine kinase type II
MFPDRILSLFRVGRVDSIEALGNRGGFSGAALFRCESASGPLCLRGTPATPEARERLTLGHVCIALGNSAGLGFVPGLHLTRDGKRWLLHEGRYWELQTWMPGRADFHDRPTPERLKAACVALGQLHRACQPKEQRRERCPALVRRLDACREWQALHQSDWRPALDSGWAADARECATTWLPRVEEMLLPWDWKNVRVQLCHCDVWHDHLLFEEDRLTGLVDYGAVKYDHVAVDLARMLGSLVEDDDAAWAAGLTAYRGPAPLSSEEEALARVLDRTGTIVAVANWVRWLYHDGRTFEDREAVARRVQRLVRRVRRWPTGLILP